MNCRSALRASAAGLVLGLGLAGPVLADTTLELFQTKREAVATYDSLIAKFEALHPGIKITQTETADPFTVLAARMAKDDLPDIIAIQGNASFKNMLKAGVLHDYANDKVLDQIRPSFVDAVRRASTDVGATGVFAVPYTGNAVGVLYNIDIFNSLGLKVPKTWDEFIATAEAVEKSGKTAPFYLTFKDSWAANVPFNALTGNLVSKDFPTEKYAGKTTFAANFREVAEKMLVLMKYSQKDIFGKTYNQGNQAMARGEGAMYLQGAWATPAITAINPNSHIGAFVFPASNTASDNKVVSGLDTVLTVTTTSKNPDAAEMFVDFLVTHDAAQQFVDEQKQFSAVKGVGQTDPALAGFAPYFENGTVADYMSFHFPPNMDNYGILNEFLLNGNVDAFLAKMDSGWDEAVKRQ